MVCEILVEAFCMTGAVKSRNFIFMQVIPPMVLGLAKLYKSREHEIWPATHGN